MIDHPRATWIDPTQGRPLAWRDLLDQLAGKRAVLLGETHDIAEIHRWQLHVAVALHAVRPRIALGFEMFPRRVQPALDAWVAGGLSTEAFLQQSEWDKVWRMDPGLYLPLFHFCRQQNVPMLALNCERPLVTRVGVEGWDAIPEEERDGLTPAAPATDAYREWLGGFMRATSGEGDAASARPAISDRFIRAQQTWDRSFACRIAAHIKAAPATLVIGIIGRGHLEFGHGTPYQLRDLGIEDVAVLLPTTAAEHDLAEIAGSADAIFRLDTPDPPPLRAPFPRREAAGA
jgi:uncharacterized iron-regulated protein